MEKLIGYIDAHSVPIREGDLVIVRERGDAYRRMAAWLSGVAPFSVVCWFGKFGRSRGRAWLGVVEPCNAKHVNGSSHWRFRSINRSACIHGYWASQLEVVRLPNVGSMAMAGLK